MVLQSNSRSLRCRMFGHKWEKDPEHCRTVCKVCGESFPEHDFHYGKGGSRCSRCGAISETFEDALEGTIPFEQSGWLKQLIYTLSDEDLAYLADHTKKGLWIEERAKTALRKRQQARDMAETWPGSQMAGELERGEIEWIEDGRAEKGVEAFLEYLQPKTPGPDGKEPRFPDPDVIEKLRRHKGDVDWIQNTDLLTLLYETFVSFDTPKALGVPVTEYRLKLAEILTELYRADRFRSTLDCFDHLLIWYGDEETVMVSNPKWGSGWGDYNPWAPSSIPVERLRKYWYALDHIDSGVDRSAPD